MEGKDLVGEGLRFTLTQRSTPAAFAKWTQPEERYRHCGRLARERRPARALPQRSVKGGTYEKDKRTARAMR
jgi:hypothetical protein